VFLYDSHGKPIAYRRSPEDRWLWGTGGRWLGWFPWYDNDAYTKNGQYLGTVIGNRLFRRISQPYRGYPGYSGYPGYAGYPGYGGYGSYSPAPHGYREVGLNA